jgi:HD-GYP domain-containing protein (c-di-GMP phosphodiesterase class II)
MKPDRLEPDERRLLQTHTTQGAEVLKAAAAQFGAANPSFGIAIEVVRSHHERWDGLGYPDGLIGDAIPISARVVAIVAAYEAMRSRRPHRPPLSHARTVRILTTECGSQFDPILLAAFARISDEFDQIHYGQ